MRHFGMIVLVGLAGCSAFSSRPKDTAQMSLNDPYWDRVNVEVVITKSSDCDNADAYIRRQELVMRKNKTETIDVPSGANLCWRHDRNPNDPVPGAWSNWTKATLMPGGSGESDI